MYGVFIMRVHLTSACWCCSKWKYFYLRFVCLRRSRLKCFSLRYFDGEHSKRRKWCHIIIIRRWVTYNTQYALNKILWKERKTTWRFIFSVVLIFRCSFLFVVWWQRQSAERMERSVFSFFTFLKRKKYRIHFESDAVWSKVKSMREFSNNMKYVRWSNRTGNGFYIDDRSCNDKQLILDILWVRSLSRMPPVSSENVKHLFYWSSIRVSRHCVQVPCHRRAPYNKCGIVSNGNDFDWLIVCVACARVFVLWTQAGFAQGENRALKKSEQGKSKPFFSFCSFVHFVQKLAKKKSDWK